MLIGPRHPGQRSGCFTFLVITILFHTRLRPFIASFLDTNLVVLLIVFILFGEGNKGLSKKSCPKLARFDLIDLDEAD